MAGLSQFSTSQDPRATAAAAAAAASGAGTRAAAASVPHLVHSTNPSTLPRDMGMMPRTARGLAGCRVTRSPRIFPRLVIGRRITSWLPTARHAHRITPVPHPSHPTPTSPPVPHCAPTRGVGLAERRRRGPGRGSGSLRRQWRGHDAGAAYTMPQLYRHPADITDIIISVISVSSGSHHRVPP